MTERGKLIAFPLEGMRKSTETGRKKGRLIQFPQHRIRKPKKEGSGETQFNYYGVEIASVDGLIDDSEITINGVTLGEYLEDYQRNLLDYPEANTGFVDATLTRVFDARCVYIGQKMEGQEGKRILREVAERTLDKADELESADQLRESVYETLRVAFGTARAGKILVRRDVVASILEYTAKEKVTPRNRSHLRVIK